MIDTLLLASCVALGARADDPLALPEESALTDREAWTEFVLATRADGQRDPFAIAQVGIERAVWEGAPVLVVTERTEAADAEALGVVRGGHRTLYTEGLELIRRRSFSAPVWEEPDVFEVAWSDGELDVGLAHERKRRSVRAKERPVAGALTQVLLAPPDPGSSRELVVLDGVAGAVERVTLTHRRSREVELDGQLVEARPFWISGAQEQLLYVVDGEIVQLTTEEENGTTSQADDDWGDLAHAVAANVALHRSISDHARASWTSNRGRWTSELLGLELKAKDWVAQDTAGTLSLALGDAEGQWSLQVRQWPVGDSVDLAGEADRVAAAYREEYEFGGDIERTEVTFAKHDAVRLQLHPREHFRVIDAYVLLDRGLAFQLSTVCRETAVEDARKGFERALKSVRFTKRELPGGRR